jgi:hypothetical protein
MKKTFFILLLIIPEIFLHAGIIEKTYYFNTYKIESRGIYQTVNFENTTLSGIAGEPVLPWKEIILMLPPGEVAESMEMIEEDLITIPGSFLLFPKQQVSPTSKVGGGDFMRNDKVYQQKITYPGQTNGRLMTQYLNGFVFALATYTPLRYNPSAKLLTYYGKVTVRIKTQPAQEPHPALDPSYASSKLRERVKSFAQNPEMLNNYEERKSPLTGYQYLIISPVSFKNEFQPLISMYAAKGIYARVVALDTILSNVSGYDDPEKIRNFIINQVQNQGVEYVLLAGIPPLMPCRGFYAIVYFGSGNGGGVEEEDYNIPSDLYFSGLDGNYDANGNHIYGEVADNPDLLPDVSVGRYTANDTAELHRMIRKDIAYQTNPVLGEFCHPLLLGEYLYPNPLTFGGGYMNLLVDNHNDYGHTTYGIPSAGNSIDKLYDTLISPPLNIWYWSDSQLITKLNQGNSFIHHLGHANTTIMLKLYMSQITNANFSAVDGKTHNFQILYTQGCYDGSFDLSGGCIAAKAVTIDNFLVAGVFNSRYGWFDEGSADGPSEHLEREFVSALYDPAQPEKHIGTAHMLSKIKTAPFIGLPGEWEPGAQRWCHYCCNVFGDPALEIWTAEPSSFSDITWTGAIDSDWMNPGNWDADAVPATLNDVIIPVAPHHPVISTVNTAACHNLTIQNGAVFSVSPGKSMIVYGKISIP